MRGFMGALGAIGLGALIGAMVALAIDPTGNGLWVIGALTGGAVAYIGYDFKTTWKAIVFVFKIPYWIAYGIVAFVVGLGRMLVSAQLYITWMSMSLALGAFYTSVALFGVGALYVFGTHLRMDPLGTLEMLYAVCVAMGAFLAIGSYVNDEDHGAYAAKMLRKMALACNPIAVIFYWPVVGVINSGKVVKMIHSDVRVVCFLYGSAGAAAGWFIGHGRIGEKLIPIANTSVAIHAVAPLAGAAIGILLAAIAHAVVPAPAAAPVPKD